MNILIVDDDRLVCEALNTILSSDDDIDVLGMGHSAQDAIRLYDELLPELVLMDIRMGESTGIYAAEVIKSKYSNAAILFLTTFSDEEYIAKALKIGAKGYILKQNFESIIPSVKAVASGQNVYGNEIIAKIPKELSTSSSLLEYDFSERENAIIKEVAEGFNNKEISEHLYLSEGTVRNYLSTILLKLGLRDRTQLAIFYYKNIQ
jgi:DNA-binding NarL/FixJ family response regulator